VYIILISKIWSLNYRNGTQMKLSWRVNASVCTFGESFSNIRNGIITCIFFSRSNVLSRKIERKYGETSKFAWKTAWQVYYFRIRPPKIRTDHGSQKSGFRFDLMYPLGVWILQITNPWLIHFRVQVEKRKMLFWIQESGFGFCQRNAPLDIMVHTMWLQSKQVTCSRGEWKNKTELILLHSS